MSESPKFDRFKVEWLLIGDLQPHPTVQRPVNEKWWRSIADNFDPDKFRPLDVIVRGGKYLVFAGQHRLLAARAALGDDQRIPCHVRNDMSIADQAATCLGVDNMLVWKTLDKWALRIMAQEDAPVKIEAILHRHQLRVEKSPGEGVVRAVVALESVYVKQGGEAVLERTLKILLNAYGRDKKDAFDGMLIRGVGLLVHRFAEQLDDEDLIRKLAKHSGPSKMLGSAKDYADTNGISVPRAMAAKILMIYNGQRRTGKLEL